MSLSVRTERDDAWVHGLASQLGRKLEELKRGAKNASAQQLAVLLALNMAEELQLEREKTASLTTLATTTLARVQGALAALDEEDSDEEEEEDAVVVAEA
jgi:cell division protein ZapA (FtsZ GTPase activity inhibitor)